MNKKPPGLRSKLYDAFYLRLCRNYSRCIVKDAPSDSVYRFLCGFQFFRIHRYWPNFKSPRRLSERIWSRMLHDRDPVLTMISDKVAVREFVQKKVDSKYLIPLLWVGTDPDEIPFDSLPEKFVIKANHGCAYNIIVTNKNSLDRSEVASRLRTWLAENHCDDIRLGIEYAYRHISPKILIEEFIGNQGKVPEDFKFYCFGGRVEFLTQHFNRFEDHVTRSFDRNYQPHEFTYHFEQFSGPIRRPDCFDEMVDVAERLAAGFAFMRVDLYESGGKVYFGEMTPYPGGVSTRFLPVRQDDLLGRLWQDAEQRLASQSHAAK